jgi:cytidine deaminase
MDDMTHEMQQAFTRLPDIRRGPYESMLHESYAHSDFINSITPANILLALHLAREARECAVSYRGFKVGAAVIGITWNRAGFQIMPGINAKTNPDGPLNMHAEQLAMSTARYKNADAISVVAVVGNTQNDQQSGHAMNTLHPCGLCRNSLRHDTLIHQDETLIFSALPDLRTIEAGTVSDYVAYHEDPTANASRVTLFEFGEMELLDPVVVNSDVPVIIKDTPEKQAEERAWTDTIGLYTLRHRMELLNNPR